MGSLADLVADLSSPFVQVLTAPAGLDAAIARLVVQDAAEPCEAGRGDLVVAIGIGAGRDGVRQIAELGRAAVSGVVLRMEIAEALLAISPQVPMALLGVPAGASWSQVILLLSSVISRGNFGMSTERIAGADAGDLFAVANVIADLVDAPITIEDPQSRVIAFSRRQEEADPARAATILGRQVPEAYLLALHQRGVFKRLAEAREPLYIDGLHADVLPRAAIAVRSGDEVLGSIWAAVHSPLAPDRERALIEAAGVVALHLLRHRLISDTLGGLEADLLATVFEGGTLAGESAQRLKLRGAAFRVVAVVPTSGHDDDDLMLSRCRDVLAMHLSATHRGSLARAVGGTLYAVIPVGRNGELAGTALRETMSRFASRVLQALRVEVSIGIGSQAATLAEVPASRSAADQVLRVMQAGYTARTLAEVSEVASSILLLKVTDACGDDPLLRAGGVERLAAHDAKHRTAYLPTLQSYLDAFGNVDATSRQLGVHENTVRYRLRQLQAIAPLDLGDPIERLSLMLQLRLRRSPDGDRAPTGAEARTTADRGADVTT